jgi:eukaryotic-like serine/threonine-protein kinase
MWNTFWSGVEAGAFVEALDFERTSDVLVQSAAHESDLLPWSGTARYQVLRRIGHGGMGVVYEAYDREQDRRIAIKTLLRFSPSALYLFKQEFRTLANVLHRNLVRLYEFVASESDGVFLTMELVSGQDFRVHTQRPEALAASARPPPTTSGGRSSHEVEQASGTRRRIAEATSSAFSKGAPSGRGKTPADANRLRDALRQLAEGVHALHSAGKIHRDIKPSNVLVNEDGRVVLLDFGVATDLSRVVDTRLLESNVVGTPVYMAPEQALDQPLTDASDWYSVGVLLYEALVGKPPFVGDAIDVVYRKSMIEPPPPRDLVEGVPEDLDALCCELLRCAPEERPTGRQVLARLGVRESRPMSPTPIAGIRHRPPLVGRGPELQALHEAFIAARTRGSVVMRVRGASGMGKSALVQHFLEGLTSRSDAVILRGCAYERESVAYKAVDGMIDALSRCLMALEQRGAAIPLPPDAWALACLFPVLRRVESIAALPARAVNDPQRVRQQAFAALRTLLSEVARLGPMVVHLDDVHWGDVDSATLLTEIMRPPNAPRLLLILGERQGRDAEDSPFLKKLLEQGFEGTDVRSVLIRPLGLEDARQLALDLMGAGDDNARLVADAIARGSGGSAFFVEDLARSVHARGLPSNADAFLLDAGSTLEQVIERRVARLDPDARGLLELVATHGRPVAASILRRAASGIAEIDSRLGDLRARRFVHLAMRDGRETVETTHDRIRETVVAQLSADVFREHHRRLAGAYEGESNVDAEAIVGHWFDAREPARAAEYAERAAQQATDKMAFDRAADLYELARSAQRADSPDGRRIRLRLAEALGWAGRGAEAARLYLEAARDAPSAERMALEQAGANQLLMCGQIEEGTRILRTALARSGRAAPRSAWSALFWIIVYSVWLRIRGLLYVPRALEEIPAEVRDHLEALYASVTGLALVDSIVGASLLNRFVVTALDSGNPRAIGAAVALAATQEATRGGVEGERERALVKLADETVGQLPEAERPLQALQGMRSMRCFLRGRWREAFEAQEVGHAMLPSSRGGWNAHAVAVYAEFALGFLGEAAELGRRLPALLTDAERRGDRLKVVNLRTGVAPLVHLAQDDPDGARRQLVRSVTEWPQRGFLIQHWRAMIAEVDIYLYGRKGALARERLARHERAYRRSMLGFAQYVRAITRFARARCAIACAQDAGVDGRRALREASTLGRRLEREATPWIGVLASLVAAAVANAEGRSEEACERLREAAQRAREADMALHAAATEHHQGILLGAQGREQVRRAEEAMRAKGVQSPDRYAAMLLPGSWPLRES